MEKDIWNIIIALDKKRITVIEAHKALCDLYVVREKDLLNQCLEERKEVINSPIRFDGVHINKLKQVFLRNGIGTDVCGF